ncbi:MAG: bifunctional adenosylcobinamide kinase/adenosylcobinamide-phosphate guanylyltransferase [Thermoguttaceae bacterium]
MARMILVVGGCRSGKSAYAQRVAESLPGRRLLVATCPVIDEEMARRVEAHRRARSGRGWETAEEPLDLAGVLRRSHDYQVLLVDCITLWVNNLMHAAAQQSHDLEEDEIVGRCREMLAAAEACPGTIVFVTNEVGMGIVPEHAAARRYRDLAGRANQEIATRADTVTLLTCGIARNLKEIATQ